jgi:hypothetical protein
LSQSLIEHPPRGAYEWAASYIFRITGLFTYEHHAS